MTTTRQTRTGSAPSLAPGRQRNPKQARGQATLSKILDTGAELLAEKGFAAFNITDVCQRAHVSPGALYRYFDSKDALVFAVQEREFRRFDNELSAALNPDQWRDQPLATVVNAVVVAIADHFHRHEPVVRELILHSGADPEMRKRASEAVQHGLRQRFFAALKPALASANPKPRDETIDGCFRLVFDSLAWRAGYGADFESSAMNTDHGDWTRFLARTILFRIEDSTPK
jgi:AcrR family transcriptional regulator